MLEIVLARGKGPLLATCGLIVLACGASAWMIMQAQREQAIVQQQLVEARQNGGRQISIATGASASDRLARFQAALGTRQDLDQHMRKVYEAARKRSLALDVGEYRLVNDPSGGFQRYQVQLPIDGPFSGIQSFSQQVLLELPFAALESMTLQRESIDAPIVEAQLRFVLFLADRSAAQRAAGPQAAAR